MNDREIILGTIEEYFEEQMECRMKVTAKDITDRLIANGVTIQKHGRWMYGGRTPTGNTVLVCSECRHDRTQQFFKEFDHYCPNCGAKMDLEG